METSALEMIDITKTFPGVHALKKVSLQVRKSEILALIGENGAGKSTLMNVLMGNIKPNSGTISIDNHICNIRSPIEAISLGIGMVPQEISLVPNATIAENLFLGNENKNKNGMIQWRQTKEAAEKLLSDLGVHINVESRVRQLSVAYQQLVQVARTVATGARILIFDEPTASLTEKEVNLLFAMMRKLKKEGKSIIFISHRLEELKAITDRITIMRDGEVIHTDDTKNISIDQMIHYMANSDTKVVTRSERYIKAEPILSVKNFSRAGEFTDISFDVYKGEIFGVGGLVGSKRTELMNAIFGITRKTAGQLEMHNIPVNIKSPRQAIKLGIGYVPEERRRDGIFPGLSVGENLSITLYEKLYNLQGINFEKVNKVCCEYVNKMNIKTPSIRIPIKNLSGGNQQKVILSRWLARKIDILILDEPTRGIDVNAKSEIYQLIRNLSDEGLTVIMVSSEHNELLTLCDRIMVMHEGKVRGFLNASTATQEDILRTALINSREKD